MEDDEEDDDDDDDDDDDFSDSEATVGGVDDGLMPGMLMWENWSALNRPELMPEGNKGYPTVGTHTHTLSSV
eukprot:scaffold599564_cov33-Prasinocladus_malaysianus.AAC.1